MDDYKKSIEVAVQHIGKRLPGRVRNAIILGSGLGMVTEEMKMGFSMPYGEIPGFPASTISGQGGELLYGSMMGKEAVVFSGRFHFYQGYSMKQVTLPVRIAKRLGVEVMVITNACGGINEQFSVGDIMLIVDHINLMGANPLAGQDAGIFGSPFVDMSAPYDPELIQKIREVARNNSDLGKLQEGVYIGVQGPSYETKAEISFFRTIGADVVGMSTVPEVIVCAQEEIRVIGISAVSNMATGIKPTPHSHQEVLENTAKMGARLKLLIKELFEHVLP
jgi:purine-nucleoside phosphorylase